MDGWNTIFVSFWNDLFPVSAAFTVSFREGIIGVIISHQYPGSVFRRLFLKPELLGGCILLWSGDIRGPGVMLVNISGFPRKLLGKWTFFENLKCR